MANVICSKCGATGKSKCPTCRSVFPDNQHEAVLSHMLKFKDDGEKTVITFTEYDANPEKALKGLYDILRMMQQQKNGLSFKGYACSHTWKFAPGCKSDIDCGH